MSNKLSSAEMAKRYAGKAFNKRTGGRQEILTVLDVTVGGDPIVRFGGSKKTCLTRDEQVTQEKWLKWVQFAKEVKHPPRS